MPWCATELLWLGPAELFLWRTGLGAPQKYMIFLWRMYPCATEKKFVATILWRTQQTWGCATESENGAPLILLSVVVVAGLRRGLTWHAIHVKLLYSEMHYEKS